MKKYLLKHVLFIDIGYCISYIDKLLWFCFWASKLTINIADIANTKEVNLTDIIFSRKSILLHIIVVIDPVSIPATTP